MAKSRLIIGVICIIGLAVLGWSIYSTLEKQDYNVSGIASYNERNYDKAIEYFTKAIELDPNNTRLYRNRGLAYYGRSAQNRIDPNDEAIADFSKAVELDPEYVDAYYNRGLAYCGEGHLGIHHYHKLPGEAWSPEMEDRYEKALADFNKVLELDPDYVLVHAGKGNLFYKYYDSYEGMEKAMEEYNKALAGEDLILQKVGEKGLAGVYYSRGRTYTHMGEWGKAESDYLKALELDPQCDIAIGHLIHLYWDWGKSEELIALTESEIGQSYHDIHPDTVGLASGISYYKLGQYDKAKAELEAPSTYQGMHGALWGPRGKRCLAKIYRTEGDETRARAILEEAIEMSNEKIAEGGRTFTAYCERGLTYIELKEYDKAISDLVQVIEAKAASDREYGHTNYYIEAHIGLGKLYLETGETEKAKQYFEKAIELLQRPGGAEPMIGQVQALLQQL